MSASQDDLQATREPRRRFLKASAVAASAPHHAERDGYERRQFLKASAAAAAGSVIGAGVLRAAGGVHAGANDTLRVALIGCGGRGTGAAKQALRADKNVTLTVMADAFEDRLQSSLANLKRIGNIAGKIDVPEEQQFVGFDAAQKAIDSDVDVVLLTAPPHFRPAHLKAAIAAGKHVFAEKPVAVDAPGVRSVLESCREAKEKGLSIVSGLCLRYSKGFGETIDRIHQGEIGQPLALQVTDLRGSLWVKPRQVDWTDMHWQMRNWYYFTWLSGDFNVEQHVHYLDIAAWILKDVYPIAAYGIGGRLVRRGEQFGNIYDHHSVTYEYEDGTRVSSQNRQIPACYHDTRAEVVGAKGRALLSERRKGLSITTDKPWVFRGEDNSIYQTEHDELFASIRNGKAINNGRYMALSTMMAIMGRMATYTGKKISWDEALNSKEDLSPPSYEWGSLDMPPVSIPGVTPFV